MKPILFNEYETNFNTNGIGVLIECVEAKVREVRNGLFELELTYPVSGRYADQIVRFNIISAKPNMEDDNHNFRIYEVKKSTDGNMLYVKGMTTTNSLSDNLVTGYDSLIPVNPQTALNALKVNSVDPITLDFVSNIISVKKVFWDFRNPLSCIVGQEGSLSDLFGGELKRTNDTVYWYNRRGRDNVATIRPKKNLKGFTITTSGMGMVTRILPYITVVDEETQESSMIRGSIVNSKKMSLYSVRPIVPVDFSNVGDTEIKTLEELNNAAKNYFTTMNPGIDEPKVTVDVQLLTLEDSSNYKKFKSLEKISLTDTVTIYIPKYNVDMELKVVELVYDSLGERNISLVLGDQPSSTSQTMRQGIDNRLSDLKNFMLGTIPKIAGDIVQKTADGLNNIYGGSAEPYIGVSKKGDIWFKDIGSGRTDLYMFDGAYWQPVITKDILDEIESIANSAADASQEALDMIQGINDDILYIKSEFTTMKNDIDSSISDLEREVSLTNDNLLATDNKAQQAIRDAGFVAQDLNTLESITDGIGQKAIDALSRANLANQGISGLQTKVDGIDVDVINLGTELGSLNVSVTNQGATIGGIQTGLGSVTNQVNEFGTVIGKSGLDMGWEPGGVSDTTGSPISDPDKIRTRQQEADHTLPFIAQTKSGGVVPMDVYEYNKASIPPTDIMDVYTGVPRRSNIYIPQRVAGKDVDYFTYVDDNYTEVIDQFETSVLDYSSDFARNTSNTITWTRGNVSLAFPNTVTTLPLPIELPYTPFNEGRLALDGSTLLSGDGYYTDYIPVSDGDVLAFKYRFTYITTLYLLYFDSNGQFIRQQSHSAFNSKPITLPSTLSSEGISMVRATIWVKAAVHPSVAHPSLYNDYEILRLNGVKLEPLGNTELVETYSVIKLNWVTKQWEIVATSKDIYNFKNIDISITTDDVICTSNSVIIQCVVVAVLSNAYANSGWALQFESETHAMINPSDYNYAKLYGKKSITEGVYLAGEDVDMVRFVAHKDSEIMIFNDTERRNYDNTIRAEIQGVSDRLSITTSAVDNNAIALTDLALKSDGLDLSVTEVNNRLDGIQTSIPGHVYKWVDGSLSTSTGGEVSSVSVSRTEMVDVVEGSKLRLVNSKGSTVSVNVFRYTINKDFIDYSTIVVPANDTYIYTIPEGSGYVRSTVDRVDTAIINISKYDDSLVAYELRINQLEVKANSTNNTISQIQIDLSGKATVTAFNQVKSTVDAHTITISNIDGRLVTNETTINGIKTSVANKADKTEVATLASQWSTTTSLVNGHTSQINSMGTEINLAVSKGDVVGRINIQAGKTLIQQGTNVLMITDTTTYISDATIKTAHIADAAITDAKIANLNAGKITTGILDASKVTVANLVITNTMIASNSISGDKITTISGSKITTGTIDASVVTVSKLNASNLTTGTINAAVINIINLNASSISSGTLSASFIKGGTIDARYVSIAHLTITDSMIAVNSISGNRLTSISGDKITTGTINAKLVTVANIDASNIKTGTLNAALVNVTNINANNITVGSLDVSRLTGSVASFVMTAFNSMYSSLTVDSTQITIKRPSSTIWTSYRGDGIYVSNSKVIGYATNGDVTIHEEVRFNIPQAYQLIRAGAIRHSNGTVYPAILAEGGKVGIMFGSTELYLLRNGIAYPVGTKLA